MKNRFYAHILSLKITQEYNNQLEKLKHCNLDLLISM